MNGDSAIDRSVLSNSSRAPEAQAQVAKLHEDERLLLRSALAGYSLIQSAGRLGMTSEEAATMKARVMGKLNATQTADLVRIGLYAGIEPDL